MGSGVGWFNSDIKDCEIAHTQHAPEISGEEIKPLEMRGHISKGHPSYKPN